LNELVRALGYEIDDSDMSDVDRYEFYEAQVLKPQSGPPMGPVPPMHPTPPVHPRPPMPPMPNPQAKPRLSDEQRQKIMDDWNAGKISAEEALERLNG
jgi:hypothetical protein